MNRLMTFARLRVLVVAAMLCLTAGSRALADTDSVSAGTLQRPVTGFYNLEVGSRSDLNTYLSPLRYRGTDLALSGLWTKSLPFNPRHMSMTFETRINMASMTSSARMGREYDFHAFLSWGMMWQKRLPHGLTAGAGGCAGIYGGAVYNIRNSNNPVAAQAMTGLALNAMAAWNFRIGRLPVLLSDRLSIPSLNLFFMPEYGESYYEIYLGNHRNLVHTGWWGNNFGIDNLLSLTLDFGKTAMQIGYRFSWQESYANNLTGRTFRNAFVIGVVPGGLGLKKKNNDSISPLF